MKQLLITTDDIIARLKVPVHDRFELLTLEEYSSRHLGREMHDLASIAMARAKHHLDGLPPTHYDRYASVALGHVVILGVYGDDITARKEFDYHLINPLDLPVLMIAGRLYIPVVPDEVYEHLRYLVNAYTPAAGKLPVIGKEALTEVQAYEGVPVDQIDWSIPMAAIQDPVTTGQHSYYDPDRDDRLLLDTNPGIVLPADALADDEANDLFSRKLEITRLATLAHLAGKTLDEYLGYEVKVFVVETKPVRGPWDEREETVPAE